MSTKSDPQLLREYAGSRSEAAFAELVRRHLDLVHSAALRITGDAHLAKDVSQGVFVALAKDAGKLAAHPVLSGWLHATTRNIAAQTIRTEARRRKREQQAAAMNDSSETHTAWDEIAPHLDAALSELADADRDAVLLRYFENQSAKDMASVLGISAEAAQKRVNRGVEKLREKLARRSVTAGTAGLAGAISANAVQTAPEGLAAATSSTALSGVISSAVATAGILTMTVLKKSLVAAAITILAGSAVYQAIRHPRVAGPPPGKPEDLSASRERMSRGQKSVVERFAKAREDKHRFDRKAELDRLKTIWMASDVNKGIITKEHHKMASETALALSCGGEALQLVGFLNANQRRIAADTVRDGISEYLASKHDPEALGLLIEAARENQKEMLAQRGDPLAWKSPASERHHLLAEWSKAAGKSCSVDELEEFRAELLEKDFAQEALFGYNAALMHSDPEEAVRSTVRALEANHASLTSGESIKLLFWEELPPDLDFAKLEALLPGDEPDGWHTPVATGRQELFRKWGERDPAAAANYVIAHSDRLRPKLIEEIVGAYYYKYPGGIIPWVSQFPEGPHFDAAAKSAACYARGCPGIDELIAKIQDPKMREEAMERAKVPLCNPNTR